MLPSQEQESANLFHRRRARHDKKEEEILERMRPFTTRRHLPDRTISFNDNLYFWDLKTSVFVEQASHDEYFRLHDEGHSVFIIYMDKHNGNELLADFIENLEWVGPLPPTENSTSGDHFYRIRGGLSFETFLIVIQRI